MIDLTSVQHTSAENTLFAMIILILMLLLVTLIKLYGITQSIKKLQKDGVVRTRKGTYTFTPHTANEEPKKEGTQ